MGASPTPSPTERAHLRIAGLVLVACAWSCASGSKGQDGSYGVYEEDDGDGDTATSAATFGEDSLEAGADSMPPDLGACEGDDDCVSAPGTCWEDGECVGGQCQLAPRLAGEPCDDDDPCSDPDLCNGQGDCIGDPIPCTAPNASGMCVDGVCEGLACDPGFGDCNDDWEDGCEVALVTETDCGACGMPCSAGAHASADCSTGVCDQACEAPWVDCDGDLANGCEIPEGVPNQCDADGLDAINGCWTPWCGQSNAEGAVNFGTWYCMECSTCHVPANGLCQWCSHTDGNWFPAESCSCGAWEDLTCG